MIFFVQRLLMLHNKGTSYRSALPLCLSKESKSSVANWSEAEIDEVKFTPTGRMKTPVVCPLLSEIYCEFITDKFLDSLIDYKQG
jgi:hypothetical protein